MRHFVAILPYLKFVKLAFLVLLLVFIVSLSSFHYYLNIYFTREDGHSEELKLTFLVPLLILIVSLQALRSKFDTIKQFHQLEILHHTFVGSVFIVMYLCTQPVRSNSSKTPPLESSNAQEVQDSRHDPFFFPVEKKILMYLKVNKIYIYYLGSK